MYFIDASKAFDHINPEKLFSGMVFWCVHQSMPIKLENSLLSSFYILWQLKAGCCVVSMKKHIIVCLNDTLRCTLWAWCFILCMCVHSLGRGIQEGGVCCYPETRGDQPLIVNRKWWRHSTNNIHATHGHVNTHTNRDACNTHWV